MAKGTITLSGSTVGTKMESLEVEQGATGGVNGALIVDNNDTDKYAISVEAANIDAHVVNMTADAVTTARAIYMSVDGLTTGSALYIDSDSSSNGTRNIVDIIQNHANASGSTVLRLQQDGTGDIVNFFDGATEVFTILDGGKVGIGTAAPANSLHIDAANAGIRIEEATDNDYMQLDMVQGGRARLGTSDGRNLSMMEDGGNVGINRSSPASKLDVQGTVQVGVDNTGYDVNFYGATASRKMMWDESADELLVHGKISQRFGSAFKNQTHASWVMGG